MPLIPINLIVSRPESREKINCSKSIYLLFLQGPGAYRKRNVFYSCLQQEVFKQDSNSMYQTSQWFFVDYLYISLIVFLLMEGI